MNLKQSVEGCVSSLALGDVRFFFLALFASLLPLGCSLYFQNSVWSTWKQTSFFIITFLDLSSWIWMLVERKLISTYLDSPCLPRCWISSTIQKFWSLPKRTWWATKGEIKENMILIFTYERNQYPDNPEPKTTSNNVKNAKISKKTHKHQTDRQTHYSMNRQRHTNAKMGRQTDSPAAPR